MRGPVGVLCAVLALTACGPSSADGPDGADGVDGATAASGSATGDPVASREAAPSARPSDGESEFGSRHRFASGLVISVSSPDTFTPSENAYPSAERAVSFGIEIYNDTDQPYRLSKLSVSATVSGEEVKQVRDSARGYNGIVDADKDVPSGSSEDFTLAFAVAPEPTRLTLTLHPDGSAGDKAVFTGPV